eukprot:1384066-Heterocapsa_arctica.AAC.1
MADTGRSLPSTLPSSVRLLTAGGQHGVMPGNAHPTIDLDSPSPKKVRTNDLDQAMASVCAQPVGATDAVVPEDTTQPAAENIALTQELE